MAVPHSTAETLRTAGEPRLADVLGIDVPEWVDDALCAQVDADGFFPDKGGSTRNAKKTCGMCAVRKVCLQYALDNEERFGVWGGKSQHERRRILRQRALVAGAEA